MTNAQSPQAYLGRDAVDPQGTKIGSVKQVYLDDETGQPDWVTVHTGLFGMKEHFAPLQGSTLDGDHLVLPFGKDVVKDSPDVRDADHLDPDEQQALYRYYRNHLGGAAARRQATDTDGDRVRGRGQDTSGVNTDDAMTRSEERLNVGTEQVEAGRARLRKYIVTEQQTASVPVSHERATVDREPITDANRAKAMDGPDITEGEYDITLHVDRPIVTTEAVPVEQVKLDTETVTEQRQVTGDVRKDQIDANDDTTGPSGH